MKPFRKKIMEMMSQPLFAGIAIFVVAAAVVFTLNRITDTGLSDFVVEMNGMLMDILIFAVVIVWLYKRQEKNNRLRNYHEQLEDFRFWQSDEGVHRKVGILARLRKMAKPLPSLRRMELCGAYLKGWDLREVDLSTANLENAFLLEADLDGANLEDANLEKAYLQNASLKRTNFQNAYLGWVDFRDADLSEARLLCANLENAVLWQANLRGVDGEGAYLDGADFTNADLRESRFVAVDFGRANLRNAQLNDADLRGADLRQTADLSAEQLETAWIDGDTKLPDHLIAQQDAWLKACADRNLPKITSRFPSTRPPYRQKARKKIWTQTLDQGPKG